jgi:hypothetical protein
MFFNNEKEVEYFYWSTLEKLGKQLDKNFSLTAANKTDGYFEAGKIKVLCEIKYNLEFTNNANVARVIIQALYYIKSRQKKGLEVPSSIFVGDNTEYFIVSVKQFSDILDNSYNNEMDLEWKFSPSSAYKLNTKLYQDIYTKNIPLMIKRLDDKIDYNFIASRFTALASNENIKTKLNSDNIKKPFHYFTQSVLLNGESIKDHAKIKLFFAIITGSEDAIYSRGKVRYEGKDYSVHDGYYAGFVNIYQTKYKTSERENFVASMDSLIKEEARRFHGAYFTPKIIVDYAHETITKNLGENWKDEYVVWDPAAGTLNLTRDYQFKELYCSTLFQEELDLASDYNPEAVKFQFDFLNDEFKAERDGGKVPNGLYDAVNDKNKKVMVLMNPPYASSGTGQKTNFNNANSNKVKGSDIIKEEMKKLKLHMAVQDLYSNFIFRIMNLFSNKPNRKLFMFTKTTHLRGNGFSKFRELLLSKSELTDNFCFDSKYFEGASGGWPVMFSYHDFEKVNSSDIYGKFIKINNENKIEFDKNELFYIPGDESILSWMKSNVNRRELIEHNIALTMPTTLKKFDDHKKFAINYLGDVAIETLVRGYSGHRGIYSAPYSQSNRGLGMPISDLNLYEAISYNSVRALIKPNLYNEGSDFLKPDESNTKYEEFKYDSLVYSLFENQSYQSSLRKVGYDAQGNPINYPTASQKGNINVYNEWFFLPQSEISDLADEHFSEVYQDAKGQKDRYVYTELERLISENKLSKEALDVLEAGRKLFRDTFSVRQTLHTQFPEYHLNAWDAGFWQLRTALKKAGLESHLEDLNKKYEILENKMRPLVYELGFLKQ